MRDELGAVFDHARFAGLFPARGRPAEAPWRLALVMLFQFAEGLPDRQAAEAVRGRIDWTYALALSLTDPGFVSTVDIVPCPDGVPLKGDTEALGNIAT